jgi:homoserine dehydrogenase
MKTIHVGLLGCGTVGTGVAKILIEKQELIRQRVGAAICLKHVADIDTTRDRGIVLAPGVMTDDARRVVQDPDIDIIVEMIGGDSFAREMTLLAIENGKPVVTANKALLAAHGNEIFAAAGKKGVDLAYEASVGGCMPIIKTLRESLLGNRVEAMSGILNGTCNYILSKITDEGISFGTALSQAQENGYAEADPTLDVQGYDTAHKLAILSALAYGMPINLADIYIEGISRISPMDIDYAGQFGYRIKLLAISKNMGNAVQARVHPTMIPCDNLLASVNGNLNAISVTADAVGDILLYGYGAGMMPTASAVVADIVDLARNLLTGSAGRIPLLAWQADQIRPMTVLPIDDIETFYYFRFSALDQPGVLSTIAGVLGRHDISIKSVHQKGRKTNGGVPIVMMTHRAREAGVQQAMTALSRLDVVTNQPVLIRIEDKNGQD